MNFSGIKKNVSLENHCSFKVGGKADFFYDAKSAEKIPELIEFAKNLKIPWILIGGGTNVLFSEKGFRGLVIHIKADKITETSKTVTAEAGALLPQVARKANLDALFGIPGTVGGAVWGNAGGRDGEIKDFMETVEVYDPDTGKTELIKPKFEYRKSDIGKKIILKVTLKKQEKSDKAKIREKLKWRAEKQPKEPSAGSFFKNPGKDLSAGYLIEQSGSKGLQVGGAQISNKHANFIINLGNAAQKDIVELAKIAKERVKSKFEIDLTPEVRIIDEYGGKIKV